MTCGVPHGSILGFSLFPGAHHLFLIYISEIDNSSNKLSFRLSFADDANIFYTLDNINYDIESVLNYRR